MPPVARILWKYSDCYYEGRKLNVESGSEVMIKPLRHLRRLLSALNLEERQLVLLLKEVRDDYTNTSLGYSLLRRDCLFVLFCWWEVSAADHQVKLGRAGMQRATVSLVN